MNTTELSAKRLQEVEELIAEKRVAQLHTPGGIATLGGDADYSRTTWHGEPHWPVFVGYPTISHLAQIPFALLFVRKDPATACDVYVRADEKAAQTKAEKAEAEDSNLKETSMVGVAAPLPMEDKTVVPTKPKNDAGAKTLSVEKEVVTSTTVTKETKDK